jgi:pyrroline-5-carboxylate reductase
MIISFIGFGNMAKAMAKGLQHQKNTEIRAASPSLQIGVNEHGIKTHHDNQAIIEGADVVILAVKPAQTAAVYTEIAAKLPHHCFVISIVSGVSLSWFASHQAGIAIVRAMPNIAAAIGKSATPLIANPFITQEHKKTTELIFKNTGIISWVEDEAAIDAFTALSGSGPAYIFLFMEAMINAAINLGIEKEIATTFALQTFFGAISLARERNQSIEELRASVTSPAGTTAAALEVFNTNHFDELISAAMKAAFDRARVLGSES